LAVLEVQSIRIKALGKPKAPTPPDPRQTAAASTSTNVGTAVANAWLGNINEITPDGSTSVNQTGNQSWFDPYTDQTYEVPTFTRTTTYSPEQQAIADQQNQANLGLSTLGNQQTQRLQGLLSTPFDGSNEATEARLMELGSKRLDPVLARQDESLRTRLAQQGIKAGSAAYDREMSNQNQSRNDAYNQLMLQGRGQAFQEAQTLRNQPINEITALLSGSQVSQPQFMGANMPNIATTDVAGLVNENYNQQMGAYNQQVSQRNGLLGGLFGLGSSAIMASDERVKENIEPLGEIDGHKVYSYDYTGKFDDGQKHIGVMAQSVEKTRPDAVMTGKDGVKRVKYGALFGMGV
jgi:hypothetical protein